MRIPVIVGPTGVGKSSLALALAKALDGEIISCDSRQIYRGLDLGTAKPSPEEQLAVAHHCIDICDPAEEYSAIRWVEDAELAIESCLSRNKIPIVCGGTFLYLQMLMEERSITSVEVDISFRSEMMSNEMENPGHLHRLLLKADPDRASKVHANDHQRIIRALQNIRDESLGRVDSIKRELVHQYFKVEVQTPRDILYSRINSRVDSMMEAGLFKEFSKLIECGYNPDTPGMRCVGYSEFFKFISGESSLMDVVEEIKKHSRKYAKRQLTWLRNRLSTDAVYYSNESGWIEEAVNNIKLGV